MNQISATFNKGIKDLLTNKSALFWVIAWPIIWLLLSVFIFLRQVPEQYMALARGRSTIAMVIFSVMVSGMTNMAATISEDRQKGLFLKLKSMPIQPWKESIGRIFSVLIFSLISMAAIVIVGLVFGSDFIITFPNLMKSLGFLILAILSSSGIGLMLGSLIKSMQGSIMTGVGLAVITSALSGIFFEYQMLPSGLQIFSRFWPMSSSNLFITNYLTGNAGYDPVSALNISANIILSLLFFIAGLVIYSKFCWKSE